MPKLSIPFLIFAVLVFLAWRLKRRGGNVGALGPFIVLLVASAAQSLLVSLRWDLGIAQVRAGQVILSTLLPALSWIAFSNLTASGERKLDRRDAIHFLPACIAAIALIAEPPAVDVIITATFVTYGIALLRLLRRGPNAFAQISFSGALDVQHALYLVIFTVFGSAVADIAVTIDFMRSGGTHAPLLIGVANMAWLAAIGLSSFLAAGALPENASVDGPLPKDNAPDEEDHRIAKHVEDVLLSTGLTKDPDLTLNRLARRCVIPARQISRAINRIHNRNVSQYVNELRIKQACRLLSETDMSITTIIYESGFQTKSNFNREFLRVTGKTPSEWRNEKVLNAHHS
jgi:AraC-like DNA-binding protein